MESQLCRRICTGYPAYSRHSHAARRTSDVKARTHCITTARAASMEALTYEWTGSDDFSELDDRQDSPPVPLPELSEHKRIVLVRHGQSTWNAEGRIQGSTDFAVLSGKGQIQAHTTREMLKAETFKKMFYSPLVRSADTASIVWSEREGPTECMPALREVDLYSFQGLLKAEGKAKFGEEFSRWQRTPADFEIDGHKPVRELWYRCEESSPQISDAIKDMIVDRSVLSVLCDV